MQLNCVLLYAASQRCLGVVGQLAVAGCWAPRCTAQHWELASLLLGVLAVWVLLSCWPTLLRCLAVVRQQLAVASDGPGPTAKH